MTVSESKKTCFSSSCSVHSVVLNLSVSFSLLMGFEEVLFLIDSSIYTYDFFIFFI